MWIQSGFLIRVIITIFLQLFFNRSVRKIYNDFACRHLQANRILQQFHDHRIRQTLFLVGKFAWNKERQIPGERVVHWDGPRFEYPKYGMSDHLLPSCQHCFQNHVYSYRKQLVWVVPKWTKTLNGSIMPGKNSSTNEFPFLYTYTTALSTKSRTLIFPWIPPTARNTWVFWFVVSITIQSQQRKTYAL